MFSMLKLKVVLQVDMEMDIGQFSRLLEPIYIQSDWRMKTGMPEQTVGGRDNGAR